MAECVFTGIVAAATGIRTYVFETAVGSTCTSLDQRQPVSYVTVEMEEVRMYMLQSNGVAISTKKTNSHTSKGRDKHTHRDRKTETEAG